MLLGQCRWKRRALEEPDGLAHSLSTSEGPAADGGPTSLGQLELCIGEASPPTCPNDLLQCVGADTVITDVADDGIGVIQQASRDGQRAGSARDGFRAAAESAAAIALLFPLSFTRATVLTVAVRLMLNSAMVSPDMNHQ